MDLGSIPEIMCRTNAALAGQTTFRIGGPAAWLIEPPDERRFAELYAVAVRTGKPVYILGAGSNLLIDDAGVSGIVLTTCRLRDRRVGEGGTRLRVGAGSGLSEVVWWTARRGLVGLEGLVGIPGSVGGAVKMNAGVREGSIGECVSRVWVAAADGCVCVREAHEIGWRYRAADIDEPILAVEFRLDREEPARTEARLLTAVAERRAAQPVTEPSAGCFFKNPPGDSAGRLIDASGLKGRSVGGACVSRRHANFIINRGNATAADVLALCEIVCRRVRRNFDVSLEKEVCCWPYATA